MPISADLWETALVKSLSYLLDEMMTLANNNCPSDGF